MNSNMPPLDDGRSAIGVEVSYDELSNLKHIAKQVEITYPGSLIVTLGSNPTTGFQWPENPKITNNTVLEQYEQKFLSPEATGS